MVHKFYNLFFVCDFSDQWTTIEVNMARVYNWDIKKRQAAKASSQ